MPVKNIKKEKGSPYLLGATLQSNGCNFALFSKNSTSVTLLLFDNYTDKTPLYTIKLNPIYNKTGDIWHIFVYDIKDGQYYGYSLDGPYTPIEQGYRFNKNKLLIDPYAKAVSYGYKWNDSSVYGYDTQSKKNDISFSTKNNFDSLVKGTVIDCCKFDWGDDRPLNIPLSETIIYEMHTRAFTIGKGLDISHPGTFLGVIEMIPYLTELGITTVELLPIQVFNENENINTDPITGKKLKNFWGYSTLNFFAVESWYATTEDGYTAVIEFKKMVKALHKSGIEVILDVVYNHTGEGNEMGPTLNFRGFDNTIYYMLENNRYYKNYSGCGNTFNCNHPVVKKFILDSLRYWVVDMHVDGFRFDLAAILGRDSEGNWVPNYSILSEISHDPILSNTKIIAEGWDAAGLYQVGGFPRRWAEWNAKFRDDMRSFIKGDIGIIRAIGNRITGSSELFYYKDKMPYYSINFITAHDGFTLNDLVSYNTKHNFNNGENNRDGENNNLSWNCGVEGETTDTNILKLRDRQMKNLFTMLMISLGTPMILAGDEIKFSKKGNNNTYCQDNEFNWIDWTLKDKNKNFFEFCKYMINFRKKHPVLRRENFFTGKDTAGNNLLDITWHGTQLNKPDWSYHSHSIAFMLDGHRLETGAKEDDNNIYVAINMYWEPLDFEIPLPGKNRKWYLSVNTFEDQAFSPMDKEPAYNLDKITVRERSIIILIDK